MVDFILIVVLAAIIGGIILYLYSAKKRGETCIGCPHTKKCGGHCSGCIFLWRPAVSFFLISIPRKNCAVSCRASGLCFIGIKLPPPCQ